MYLNILNSDEIILLYNPKKKAFESSIGRFFVVKNGIYLAVNDNYQIKKLLVQNGRFVFLEWQGAIPGDVLLKVNELKNKNEN